MSTMDVRIKVTADVIKESHKFLEPVEDTSEKADNEFQFYHPATSEERLKLEIKPKSFKMKCLSRLTSLVTP